MHTTGAASGIGLAFSLWKLKLDPEALETFSKMVSSSISISERALMVTCAPFKEGGRGGRKGGRERREGGREGEGEREERKKKY